MRKVFILLFILKRYLRFSTNYSRLNLKRFALNKGFQFLAFKFLIVLVVSILLFPSISKAASPSLYLAPSNGAFLIGSTFDISVFVDTKGLKINAVELDLKFPPDILQVTSPTAGRSFVSEWLAPPSYSNTGGTVSFKGGIPNGIVTSAGLISTISFRARAEGRARIRILDSSKVLLADGKGTPVSTRNIGGVYDILIPPPEGPKITCLTHPDPEIWYQDSNPSFLWEREKGASDFSYSFSQNPREVPDTISEGEATSKTYKGVPDGIWYFHLRQKKSGTWGKASHLQVKIDTTPPHRFKIKTDTYSGFVYFKTEDVHSGIDHYEVSVTNLNEMPTSTPFFVEAVSPYKIPNREPGKYRVVVRAYDKAGNSSEAKSEFQKLSPFLSLLGDKGVQIKGVFLSWLMLYFGLFILLMFLGYLLFRFLRPRTGFRKGIKEIKEAVAEIEKIEKREKTLEKKREKFEQERKKLEKKMK